MVFSDRVFCSAYARTFGTAAWKFTPVAGVLPVTWNLAKMLTTPGRNGDVCGVSDILSSFLSYAGYAVNRGAAGCACGGGVCVCGKVNAGDATAGGGVGAEAGVESKRPRMSLTLLF